MTAFPRMYLMDRLHVRSLRVLSLASACLLMSLTARADEPAPRPNVVFLLVDDLGYADCGFNGGTEIATPRIDQLAGQGTVLESFYVQPLCSPTRAAFMTGRYPMRYGLQLGVVRPWAKYGLPLEERTLAQALQAAGYKTAICGKWHLGSFDRAYWPSQRGFNHAYGHLFGALDYFTHHRDGQLDWYRNGDPLEEEGYTTHLLTREAVTFIRNHDTAEPFFLYVPFNAVHTPLQAPDEALQRYAHLKEPRQKLAAMLSIVDEAIGQIVDVIDERELRSNTLFVFSSDNGGFRPGVVTDNGTLRAGKGTLYEGGVRVAAFATWDGKIPAGTRNDQPLHIIDWYPTLVKLAGGSLEQPLPLDGRDAWQTIAHGAPSPHAEILFNSNPRGGAIRVGDWKLVINGSSSAHGPDTQISRRTEGQMPKIELYHLSRDRSETTDLAEEQPEKLQALLARYRHYEAAAAPPKNLRPGPRR